MMLKVQLKLYDKGWKVIGRKSTLIDIDGQWSTLVAGLKATFIPLLGEILQKLWAAILLFGEMPPMLLATIPLLGD